jgi:hypothetical protein
MIGVGGYDPFDSTNLAATALVLEIGFAVALLVGQLLVRRGRVRLHAYLQSTIVLANIPVVAVWMLPAYLAYVLPGIPGELTEPFYLFPTLMLVAGVTVETLGVYVILVAGTNLLPERLRFREYKPWMRTVVVLWWAVLLAGAATFYVWYLAPS